MGTRATSRAKARCSSCSHALGPVSPASEVEHYFLKTETVTFDGTGFQPARIDHYDAVVLADVSRTSPRPP